MMNQLNTRVAILRNGIEIGELNPISCRIMYDSGSIVKRTCRIKANDKPKMKTYKIKEYTYARANLARIGDAVIDDEYKYYDFEFDSLKDLIKPYLFTKGKWWSMGVYTVISSPLTNDVNQRTFDYEMYDVSMKLKQAKAQDRLFFAKDTKYLQAINQLLVKYGIENVIQEDSQSKLNADREFEIGTPIIDVVNELLKEINFNPIHVDFEGNVVLDRLYKKDKPDFIYKIGKNSTLNTQYTKEFDIYNVPNVFIGYVSNPDVGTLYYKKVNNEPSSKLSVENRGMEITETIQLNDIASQEDLETYINELYNKSLQVEEVISFQTALDPNHDYLSSIQLDLGQERGLYIEKSWEMDLQISGSMSHVVERRVFI